MATNNSNFLLYGNSFAMSHQFVFHDALHTKPHKTKNREEPPGSGMMILSSINKDALLKKLKECDRRLKLVGLSTSSLNEKYSGVTDSLMLMFDMDGKTLWVQNQTIEHIFNGQNPVGENWKEKGLEINKDNKYFASKMQELDDDLPKVMEMECPLNTKAGEHLWKLRFV